MSNRWASRPKPEPRHPHAGHRHRTRLSASPVSWSPHFQPPPGPNPPIRSPPWIAGMGMTNAGSLEIWGRICVNLCLTNDSHIQPWFLWDFEQCPGFASLMVRLFSCILSLCVRIMTGAIGGPRPHSKLARILGTFKIKHISIQLPSTLPSTLPCWVHLLQLTPDGATPIKVRSATGQRLL